jgi:hypothetical protein
MNDISFEECEEFLYRMAWCRSHRDSLHNHDHGQEGSATTSVTLQSTIPPTTISLPFSSFAEPCEATLFLGDFEELPEMDDQELPVHLLAYQTLLALPVDVRGTCMSRIVITGGISNIPGLKKRVVDEIKALVDRRGWDNVRGKAADKLRLRMREQREIKMQNGNQERATKLTEILDDSTDSPSILAAFVTPPSDPVEEKIRRDEAKHSKPSLRGEVRGIETLGSWAGGSLVASLKVRGVVEVEREKFLQQGLAGASKETEISVVQQRQSIGPSGPRPSAGDRSSWTLGAWA